MTSKALIIAAAGSGTRMKHSIPKPFIKLEELTILEYTLNRFLSVKGLEQIIVAADYSFMKLVEDILKSSVKKKIDWKCVEGGEHRQQSICNALKNVANVDLVMIHDAVRPFVKKKHILQCCKQAEKHDAAVVGVRVKDTIKTIDENHFVKKTHEREKLWQIQTPQIFGLEIIIKAHNQAVKGNYRTTDDASLIEAIGKPVKIVEGNSLNIKITYPQDLALAKLILEKDHRNP